MRSCALAAISTMQGLRLGAEDDQLVRYANHGPLTAKLLKNGTLKDFPHGMITTHADTVNADLLTFIRA